MASPISSYASHAIRTADFVDMIGVNTHLDFLWTSYQNTQIAIDAINYLGIKNLRDCANDPAIMGANGLWQRVADATGAKFDAFMAQGSPAFMQASLSYIPQLASQHILNFIEGGNEEDVASAINSGNSLEIAALFQQAVYAMGQACGISVINMSFGAGWGSSLTGNYGAAGDLSAYADYANAHTYFGTGNPPSSSISYLNHLSRFSVDKPTIITEMGWFTNGSATDLNSTSEIVQAKYMLDSVLDAFVAGNAKTYLYELLDQKTSDAAHDNFGLFHADGTAKIAATALHNLTALLADGGAGFKEVPLAYQIAGLQDTDRSLLMQKSDGSYWLAIWNESRLASATQRVDLVVPDHMVTLNLGLLANAVQLYDPLQGTTAIQSANIVNNMDISLPDHPILVKIELAPSTRTDLALSLPGSITMACDATMDHLPVLVLDRWAASHIGTMALNLSATNGFIAMKDSSGNDIMGSGTHAIRLKGTLDQINDALATLSYHAGFNAGLDNFKVNIWNQSGYNITQTVKMNVQDSSGNDGLQGTIGKDILDGGAGNDTLTGGLDADMFRFSPHGNLAEIDSITDFSVAQGDKVHLHGFGLNKADFIALRGLSGAHSINYNPYLYDALHHQYTLISIDMNGDQMADYAIRLENTALTLHDSDFMFI